MYAIVDIETTGSYASANGITEIAIVFHDGKQITGHYETLINPNQDIPPFIASMTGITNKMVEKAPAFEEVAETIHNMLSDKIFVAHSVNFDYSFVRHQLHFQGFELNTRKLCTVRLTKRLFPTLHKYGLGHLCKHFEIENKARHRALGDALATAEIFTLLLQNNAQPVIEEMLKNNSKEQMLPPNLPREQFLQLPAKPGVYYFYNEKGKVIYVGKAKNLKARVSSHFANNSTGKQKQNFIQHIHSLTFEICSTELLAMILESAEIKRIWPEFNRSQKNYVPVFGIYDYEDQEGFIHLSVDSIKKHIEPLETFNFFNDATNKLWKLVNDFELCPKKCGLQQSTAECGREEKCICSDKKTFLKKYNKNANKAIAALQSDKKTYVISDKGRSADEKTVLLVEHGKFIGFGYLNESESISSLDELKNFVRPVKENFFIRFLIERYAFENPKKIKWF